MQHGIRINAVATVRVRVLALLLVAVFLFPSCRKGEDDPFFSLASRKKRLEGSWKLKRSEIKCTITNPDEGYYDYIMTSENGQFHFDYIGDSVNEPYTGTYELRLDFEKDGGLKMSENFNLQSYHTTGTWQFVHKGDDAAHKERVLLQMAEATVGTNFTYRPFMTERVNAVLHIKELRKNQLVLVDKGSSYLSSGMTIRLEAEFVFRP